MIRIMINLKGDDKDCNKRKLSNGSLLECFVPPPNSTDSRIPVFATTECRRYRHSSAEE
jgi:hypothetical protein